jgi:2-methylcitrate dehydratase PrpD
MKKPADINNPYTRGVASYVSRLRYEDIPDDVRERLKLVMLDSLGCGIYAAELEWSRILIDSLSAVDTSDGCAVWGSRERLSAPHATLVNGTLIQGFELDDVFHRGPIHVGAVVLPALFAVAETRPSMTGREFLTAALAGYEIAPRAALCMGPEHLGQGWHSGATAGVFGAAAAAAAGLGLDEEKTVHALGIAGTQASGLMAAQYGAMVKRMHAGRASQSGLYGALFAARGFTGIVDVFESEYGGFCTTFSNSTDRFNLDELTSGLGERYDTMEIFLKFYSCVGGVHPTLDAIRELREKRDFNADEVEKVTVGVSQISKDHSGWEYHPEGVTSAQLNMSYCMATMLLERECFVDQFSEDLVADPARLALIEKIEIKHDPEITALGRPYRHKVHVAVKLKDGAELKTTIQKRFDQMMFPEPARVIKKFDTLARHILPQSQADRIKDAVLGLEKLDDAKVLARLLTRTA